jgi:hypothetical protein
MAYPFAIRAATDVQRLFKALQSAVSLKFLFQSTPEVMLISQQQFQVYPPPQLSPSLPPWTLMM